MLREKLLVRTLGAAIAESDKELAPRFKILNTLKRLAISMRQGLGFNFDNERVGTRQKDPGCVSSGRALVSFPSKFAAA